jgi:hypothetical protein
MELCNPHTGRFQTGGHPEASKRAEFVETVFLKLHEVLVALELTAAVTAHAAVFEAVRQALRAMDSSDAWRNS